MTLQGKLKLICPSRSWEKCERDDTIEEQPEKVNIFQACSREFTGKTSFRRGKKQWLFNSVTKQMPFG